MQPTNRECPNFELSFIIPVYIQKEANTDLERILEKYAAYNKTLLQRIHFVFVDDCSPIPVSINTGKINYTLARIEDDILWNQPGARNLGVVLAKSAKIILTDLDHIFPEKTLEKLMAMPLPKKIHQFRRTMDGAKTKTHPGTFFCTKATYFKSLGFDEAFSGNYGFDDIYFVELQKKLGTKFRKPWGVWIETSAHEQHNLTRDTTVNKLLLDTKMAALKTSDPFSGHSKLFLNFKWHIVQTNFL